MKFATKAVHAGVRPDPATGAVMTPVYQTSTFAQRSPGEHLGYEYGRTHNPTRQALEHNIASLEQGSYGLAFASGMAAIDAVVKMLQPGDEVVCSADLYGGTYRIFTSVFANYGIKFHFKSMASADALEKILTPKTRLIWIETPTNPMMQIIDLARVAEIAKNHQVLLAVDNTFSSPFLQRPLSFGADIVMHSATKYLAGHSDVIMGALVTCDKDLYTKLSFIQNACGAIPGPNDCFLTLRGIKTLHLRMQRHCENGAAIARYLADHPSVQKVNWPGLVHHPGHEIAKKQMDDFGGMLSFTLKEDTMEQARSTMEKLNVFTIAESLGGVESLCGHPATMTHASMPRASRELLGITDGLIRLSVGIEDIDDLLADLEQAIK